MQNIPFLEMRMLMLGFLKQNSFILERLFYRKEERERKEGRTGGHERPVPASTELLI